MSEEKFYQGFSEYELEALRIPNHARGECLKQYVPYVKCMANAEYFSRWIGKACEDQKHTYSHCKKIQRSRTNLSHLITMKQNNPKKFEELNVAPGLETQYSPSFLSFTRH